MFCRRIAGSSGRSLLGRPFSCMSSPLLFHAYTSAFAAKPQTISQHTTTTHIIRSHYSYADGPGSFSSTNTAELERVWKNRDFRQRGFTVGIGGPVGSGKTALVLQICRQLVPQLQNQDSLAVVTNDIFTQEDAEFLTRNEALPAHQIRAVETGGCPHAAIREDVSANLSALEELTSQYNQKHKDDSNLLLLCESGGDNLAANFSRELADLTLYVIDVAGGEKVPRKGGPGITQSDLLIINKIDLAEAVGADLNVMEQDAHRMRSTSSGEAGGPTIMASIKQGLGVPEICDFITKQQQKAYEVAAGCSGVDIHDHSHEHDHQHNHEHGHQHSHEHGHEHSHEHGHQHSHEHGHQHSHEHHHSHKH